MQIQIDKQRETNEKNFPGCPDFSGWKDWDSKDAQSLRDFFGKKKPLRTKGKKDNDEHRIESLMLSALGETKGEKKLKEIHGIQPVKLFKNVARFQFPTPLAASDTNDKKYSGSSGGGIDILARNRCGRRTRICVLELKAGKEKVTNVLNQGLAYAVFIRELLHSKSGEKWYQLMGFNGKIPSALLINVVAVMPYKHNADIPFAENELSLGGNDKAILHYMYFTESNNEITAVETSL